MAAPITGFPPTSQHLKFAVIPSNGRECLNLCVAAIQPQVDKVIVINTGQSPDAGGFHRFPMRSETLDQYYANTEQVNISAWWNQGLDAAEAYAKLITRYKKVPADTWDVAILNDDAIVPEGWFDAVTAGMRMHRAAAGCSGGHDLCLRRAEAVPLDYRMQGFAFILSGQQGLRANEDLHWYFTDDYIDWESRKHGGMAMVRDYPVTHLYPNGQLTPELHEQTARDAQTFVDIYGARPW